jgi:hypothetical protein
VKFVQLKVARRPASINQELTVNHMARYGKKAQSQVKSAVRRFKKGKLKSGGSGERVKSRKQAIAIGLSEAREKGAKVPRPPKRRRRRK